VHCLDLLEPEDVSYLGYTFPEGGRSEVTAFELAFAAQKLNPISKCYVKTDSALNLHQVMDDGDRVEMELQLGTIRLQSPAVALGSHGDKAKAHLKKWIDAVAKALHADDVSVQKYILASKALAEQKPLKHGSRPRTARASSSTSESVAEERRQPERALCFKQKDFEDTEKSLTRRGIPPESATERNTSLMEAFRTHFKIEEVERYQDDGYNIVSSEMNGCQSTKQVALHVHYIAKKCTRLHFLGLTGTWSVKLGQGKRSPSSELTASALCTAH
jgi:hypothetical protein